MKQIEKVVLGLALGAVPVIAFFLAGWWISLSLVRESSIWRCALAGVLLGMILNVLFLKRWMCQAYAMRSWIWMALYISYSAGMLGFFMGVPVFNVMLSVPAGIFVGRWLAHHRANAQFIQDISRKTVSFTMWILGLVCLASASIALGSTSTGSDLQSMLMLPFPVTRAVIVCIIAGGGALMLVLNCWLTGESLRRAYEYFSRFEISEMEQKTKSI